MRRRSVKLSSGKPGSHDPAPTRFQFRLQRWWLTPGIRLALRAGLPVLALAAMVGLFFSDAGRRDALTHFMTELRASIQERPEFMVNLMAIDGAGRGVDEDIREILPIDFPVSSFDLDLEHVRDLVEGLDPVKSASVRIRPGGILQIDVTERVPVVVWRTYDGVELLDAEGVHVDEVAHRSARPDLPLIAGEGAASHVPEALALFAAAASLDGRVRALARVSERRWDVVLDRDQRILLPAENPVPALERVMALNQAQELLERDVVAIDMRLAERPTLRMTAPAHKAWWRARHLDEKGH
ncbi:MAG: cell division protein FtsQ/DivIB [Marinibacterium sp.]